MVAPHPDLQRKITNTNNIVEANKAQLIPRLQAKYPQDYIDLAINDILQRVKPWIEPLFPPLSASQGYQILYLQPQPPSPDKVLVICIDFPDRPWQVPISAVNNRFFSDTGNTLKNYYKEVSYNQYIPSGEIHGPYRIPNPSTYYTNGAYGRGAYPHNDQGLFEDVINIIKNDLNINWSAIDVNNDNTIDSIMIVCAGANAGVTGNVNDFWPSEWGLLYNIGSTGKLSKGVAFVSEYHRFPSDAQVSGTDCHEFGHTLGLPDLYYGSGTAQAALGYYSLMANGNWLGGESTPSHLDAYSKYRLGFTDISINSSGLLTLNDTETNNRSYLFTTKNYNIPGPYPDSVTYEYFIIENRQKKLFDLYLPSNGIFIYHVKETFAIGAYLLNIDLEQADGRKDLQNNVNYGDLDDPYPGTTNNRAFGKSTNPNTKLYDNTIQNIEITNISNSSNIMTMTVTLPTGSVRFHTSPGGADIWVGTTKLGITDSNGTLLIQNLATGTINYMVKKTGYYNSPTQTVTVVENTTVDTPSVTLVPIIPIGSVRFHTNPSGADIWVGTTKLGTTDPTGILLVSNLATGAINYIVKKTGYYDSPTQTVTVVENTTVDTSLITLVPIITTGSVRFHTSPGGADIWVGTNKLGTTDSNRTLLISGLTVGSLNYIVKKTGYYDSPIQTVIVVVGTTVDTPSIALVPIITTGSVYISTDPIGAKIYVDNIEQIGKLTPATISDLSSSPPSHTYKLTLDGYEDAIGMLDITGGQTITIPTITLTPISSTVGTIIITSTPYGAKIYIDGIEQIRKFTPETITGLYQGHHVYKLTLTGYKDVIGEFDIMTGETKIIDVGDLTPIVVQAGFGGAGMVLIAGLVIGAIYSTTQKSVNQLKLRGLKH